MQDSSIQEIKIVKLTNFWDGHRPPCMLYFSISKTGIFPSLAIILNNMYCNFFIAQPNLLHAFYYRQYSIGIVSWQMLKYIKSVILGEDRARTSTYSVKYSAAQYVQPAAIVYTEIY